MHSEIPSGAVPNATAIQFFPSFIGKDQYGLLVGQESGAITVWVHLPKDNTWAQIHQFHRYLAHGMTVRRIKFGKWEAVESKEAEY